jgi:response regulator of citrate/malate metabolism
MKNSEKISDYYAKRKEGRVIKEGCNCLSEILLELMNERKIEAADIHKATGISHSTLHDYINFKTKTQRLDGNIAFGIGEPDPVFDLDTETNKRNL